MYRQNLAAQNNCVVFLLTVYHFVIPCLLRRRRLDHWGGLQRARLARQARLQLGLNSNGGNQRRQWAFWVRRRTTTMMNTTSRCHLLPGHNQPPRLMRPHQLLLHLRLLPRQVMQAAPQNQLLHWLARSGVSPAVAGAGSMTATLPLMRKQKRAVRLRLQLPMTMMMITRRQLKSGPGPADGLAQRQPTLQLQPQPQPQQEQLLAVAVVVFWP